MRFRIRLPFSYIDFIAHPCGSGRHVGHGLMPGLRHRGPHVIVAESFRAVRKSYTSSEPPAYALLVDVICFAEFGRQHALFGRDLKAVHIADKDRQEQEWQWVG